MNDIESLSRKLKEALSGYIGDPLTSKQMDNITESVKDIITPVSGTEKVDISQHPEDDQKLIISIKIPQRYIIPYR